MPSLTVETKKPVYFSGKFQVDRDLKELLAESGVQPEHIPDLVTAENIQGFQKLSSRVLDKAHALVEIRRAQHRQNFFGQAQVEHVGI